VLPTRALLLCCAASTISFAADSSGKFNIYMNGKPIAHETYVIQKSDGKITIDGSGSADMGLLKINIEQFKVVTDDSYKPLEAAAKAQMGKATMAVQTTFVDNTAKNQVDTGQGPQTKEHAIHGDDVVINSNLPIFPWSLLAPRVNLDASEPQQFYAYILGQAEEPLTVTVKGQEPVQFANKTVKLTHIAGEMPTPSGQKIEADIWIDGDRNIVKMLVPAQNVEVYRDGFQRLAPAEPKPENNSKTPQP
jgi:hypothetical protein